MIPHFIKISVPNTPNGTLTVYVNLMHITHICVERRSIAVNGTEYLNVHPPDFNKVISKIDLFLFN